MFRAMKHAYLVETGRTIAPFERPVGQMKVHTGTLAQAQERILSRLGCKVQRVASLDQIDRFPCLVADDDLFFTYHAAKRFVRAARQNSGQDSSVPLQAALAVSELTERFFPVLQGPQQEDESGQQLRSFGLYYITSPEQLTRLEAARLVPIPYRYTRITARASRYFEESGRFVVPVSQVFMMPIRHWAALLPVNLLGMTSHVLRHAAEHPFSAAALPLKAALRSGSLRPSWWLSKTYFAGKGCRVAPSAHVEASILGRRVKIAPNAVVRNCILGDGVQIGPAAVVEGAVLGDRCMVNGSVLVRSVVAEEEVSLGTIFVQMSVLGRGSVLCPQAGFLDTSLRGDAQLNLDGRRIASGSRLLGGCLGDEAFLGPGVHVGSGFEIPNRCILLQHPHDVVRDVDEAVPRGVWRLDRGRRRRNREAADESRAA